MATVKTGMAADDSGELLMNPENNDGFEMNPIAGGSLTIKIPYGKDNSLYAGTPAQERIDDGHWKGGPTDLSHTLSNAKANQSQD